MIHESARSRARVGEIRTARGVVRTPGYVPVGTNAVIKAVHGSVLDDAGIVDVCQAALSFDDSARGGGGEGAGGCTR